MATEKEKGILELAKEQAARETAEAKKQLFLSASAPYVKEIDELLVEIESEFQITRVAGEDVFDGEGKLTPKLINTNVSCTVTGLLYGLSFSHGIEKRALGCYWDITQGNTKIFMIRLFYIKTMVNRILCFKNRKVMDIHIKILRN